MSAPPVHKVWAHARHAVGDEPYDRVFPKEGEGFDPYDMERAGAKLTLIFDGTVELERGLLERVVQPTMTKEPKEDAVPTYSEAVLTDLTAHKTAALRLELAQNPKVALAAVVHALGLGLLYRTGTRTCLDLSGRSANLEPRVHSLDECSAHAALAAVVDAWRETLPADPDMFWDWCLAAEADKLTDLLALLAGLTVDAAHGRDAAAQLGSVVSLDMHKHWTPKAEGFFGRLSKPLMAHLLTGAGDEVEAAKLDGLKKGEAAAKTAALLTAREWLPPALA